MRGNGGAAKGREAGDLVDLAALAAIGMHEQCAPPPRHAQVVDLDRGLTAAQRAEAAAFAALVEAKLRPAIAHTTWCEAGAFAQHTAPAYGAGLPFPLSYFVPRSQRKAVAQHFAGLSSSQVGFAPGDWARCGSRLLRCLRQGPAAAP